MHRNSPIDFSSLVFFGDSLTDNGNLFALIGQPGPPYVNGRFSNGPTYAEIAPELLGVSALNFAFGGAEAVTGNGNPNEFAPISLATQVDRYLATLGGQPAPDGAAAAIFIGNNDYLRLSITPQTPQDLVAAVLANVNTEVQRLVGAGVDKVLLFTLPGIDLSPAGAALGPAAIAGYDAIVQANNAGLSAIAAGYVGLGLDVEVVDVYRFFTEMKNDLETFGFKITTTPIIADGGAIVTHIDQFFDPDEIAFFDEVHPTGSLHGVTASFVASVLGSDRVILRDAGDDRINGGFGSDFIMAGLGNDRAEGGFGSDTIFMGAGNDRAEGGFGHDIVSGGGGNDRLSGGFGSDVVAGGAGDDDLDGGFGADALVAGRGSDTMRGGFGNDLFLIDDESGVTDHDHVIGGHGRDTLRITVAQATWDLAAFQADLADFAGSFSNRRGEFTDRDIASIGLTVDGVERLEIILDIRGQANDPLVFSAGRAAILLDADLASVLGRADLWGLV